MKNVNVLKELFLRNAQGVWRNYGTEEVNLDSRNFIVAGNEN